MELRQLRYFVKAAESLSFSEAAKIANVAQSTLSRQLPPFVNDWLIISYLKLVPACVHIACKYCNAKLVIFFDVAITSTKFLSFYFLTISYPIAC